MTGHQTSYDILKFSTLLGMCALFATLGHHRYSLCTASVAPTKHLQQAAMPRPTALNCSSKTSQDLLPRLVLDRPAIDNSKLIEAIYAQYQSLADESRTQRPKAQNVDLQDIPGDRPTKPDGHSFWSQPLVSSIAFSAQRQGFYDETPFRDRHKTSH